MAMRKKYDVVATVGEWTDAEGNKKKRHTTCGVVFVDDEGRESIKLDTIPINPAWSGWLSCYPPREKQQEGGPA